MGKLFAAAVIAFVFQATSNAGEVDSPLNESEVNSPLISIESHYDADQDADYDIHYEVYHDVDYAADDDADYEGRLLSVKTQDPKCCTIWTGRYFTGTAEKICYSYYSDWAGTPNPNPSLTRTQKLKKINASSSWACGKDVRYRFCDWGVDKCEWIKSPGGAGAIANPVMLNENDADRILFGPYDPVRDPYVTLFSDGRCQGNTGFFQSGPANGSGKQYNHVALSKGGLNENQVRAIKIPPGVYVTVWTSRGFNDVSATMYGGDWTDKYTEEMFCTRVPDAIRNNISSFEVGRVQPARGKWVQVRTHSSNIKIKVTAGFESSTTSTQRKEYTQQLEAELTVGLEGSGFGLDYSTELRVNKQTTKSTSSEIQRFSSQSQQEEIEINCDQLLPCETGVALYQWVISDSTGKIIVPTANTQCRYGEFFRTAPKCPPTACAPNDKNCLKCGTWNDKSGGGQSTEGTERVCEEKFSKEDVEKRLESAQSDCNKRIKRIQDDAQRQASQSNSNASSIQQIQNLSNIYKEQKRMAEEAQAKAENDVQKEKRLNDKLRGDIDKLKQERFDFEISQTRIINNLKNEIGQQKWKIKQMERERDNEDQKPKKDDCTIF